MTIARRVSPGEEIGLDKLDPGEKGPLPKEAALARTEELGREIEALDDLLYASGRQSVLIVLQGMDTSGKDGAIRRLLRHLNAQSTRVSSFKAPTPDELARDFLWRVHRRVPPHGSVVIFNRSHYEDVLAARVRRLVPESVWRERYAQINAFEDLLASNGTIILKFFLHIGREEQRKRLMERELDPEKAWKLSVSDWAERERWGEYMAAYEDALRACSTPRAPWFIVPADHKWTRNLAVLEVLAEALRPFRKEWIEGLEELGRRRLAELAAYRRDHPGA